MAYQGANQARPGMQNLLRQTRLCKFNLSGRCLRGSSCTFAHDEQDLKATPNLQQTRLCSDFSALGSCKHGLSCRFAHSAEELRNTENRVQEQRKAGLIQKSVASVALQPTCRLPGAKKEASSDKQSKSQSKLVARTSMCQFYLDGVCKQGNACSFAHSKDELRAKPDLSRTGYCIRFMTTGKCRHGERCRFAHSVQEKIAQEPIEHALTATGSSQNIPDRRSEQDTETLQRVYQRLCLQAASKLAAQAASEGSDFQQSAGGFSCQTTATSSSALQHLIALKAAGPLKETSLASPTVMPQMSSMGSTSVGSSSLVEKEGDDEDDESLARAVPAESSASRLTTSSRHAVPVKNTFVHFEDDAEKDNGCSRVRCSSSPASLKRNSEHLQD